MLRPTTKNEVSDLNSFSPFPASPMITGVEKLGYIEIQAYNYAVSSSLSDHFCSI